MIPSPSQRLDPGRHVVLERALLDIHGPRAVFAHVLRDAVQDRPAERRRRLDDQATWGSRRPVDLDSIRFMRIYDSSGSGSSTVHSSLPIGLAELCRRTRWPYP